MKKPVITDEIHEKANWGTTLEWSREQLTLVRDMFFDKHGVTSISEAIGCSTGPILRVLKVMGIEARPVGRIPQVTPEQKAKISRLLKLKSHNQTKIAELVGVGRFIVNRISMAERQNANQAH